MITRTQAVSANANNVAITSTSAGDYILVFAYFAGTATQPSLPSGFTNLTTQLGTGQACRVGFKVSPGGDTSSNVWTNATQVVCHVYRGVLAAGAVGTINAGNSASLGWLTLTPQVTDGSSWVVGFGGATSATAGMNGNPTGTAPNLVNRTNVTVANGLDTGAGASSFAAQTLVVTGTGRWQALAIELKATPPDPNFANAPSGGFLNF